ncbi:hypothetical protein BTVI_105818 [Pitangus sulphuratus]|nr:hypothetical protein BTVI_105818 [Pitangus sulphuratus]
MEKPARRWVNNECFREHNSPCAPTDLLEYDAQYDLELSAPNQKHPDVCLSPENKRISFQPQSGNSKLLVRVIFNVVNFSKTKSLYRDGMAPMVKSTSRPKWMVTFGGHEIVAIVWLPLHGTNRMDIWLFV